MTKTTRGSEWRKWDLHIHTPGSFYWIGNKKFQEMTPKEANEEMKVFIKNINESDVDVFCIMDYWNFNWYLALKDYIQQNPNELKKTVFPGIELRVECPVDYRLNLHCILSDKLSKQEINDFKSELCIRSIDRKLSDEALMQFAKSLDESKAKVHGFGNPENLDERKLLLLGSKTAEVTKESLDKAFHRIPKGAGYIILPYDTSDGISKLNWKSHPHDDNYFMQRAHIFEVREHSNIELISGQKNEKNRRYFDNFIKTLGGKAKPCISGSDAHEYSYYGKFPSNKITWIKADPTFEGLKQIIHEPSARVKIQPDEPDLKEETLVIDQVRFISKDDLFTPVPIVFNKNLNVIIGGKSSGKSILLYSIARTLLANRKLLKKKDPNTDKETYRYNSIIDNDDFNFEVKIGSGNTQSIKRADDEPSILPEIKYIPQNYLSKLVEPENKKGNELRKYIRELLREDDSCDTKYKDFLERVKSNDIKRENLINNYFAIRDKINSLKTDVASKGNERVLETTISSNVEKIDELKSKIGLTEEQIKEYNNYNEELENINIEIPKIQSDQPKIRSFNNKIKNTLLELSQERNSVLNSIQNESIKELFIAEYKILDEIVKASELLPEKSENIFKEQYFSILKKKENLENKLNPLVEDQEIRAQIKLLEERIFDDKRKLGEIKQVKLEIANNKEALTQEKNKIFDLYSENYMEYENTVSELGKRANLLKNDNLEIKGYPRFNFPKFRKEIFNISDGRKKGLYNSYGIFNEDLSGESDCNINEILTDLKRLFEVIIDTDKHALTGRSDNNKKNAIKVLLRDYFFDYWEAVYDKDKLYEMSAGKASFVMLMIIIGLSNSKAPILIDQPEDNLDNRSITKDLVGYLRTKKLDRQIILVTHNPNVVVNADAENIILANQKGQNDRETKSPYKFDYINGALECTKPRDKNEGDLLKSMGIREHIADIVEGGEDAFKKREAKYGFKS